MASRAVLMVTLAGCYDPEISTELTKADAPEAPADAVEAGDAPVAADGGIAPTADAPPDARTCTGAPPAGCEGLFSCGESCYSFCGASRTWRDAQAHCESWSGWLATIGSDEENGCVYYGTPIAIGWIGYFQEPGTGEPDDDWRWVNGDPVGYERWRSGEPNDVSGEDCAFMYMDNGSYRTRWNDDDCDTSWDFVCERPL